MLSQQPFSHTRKCLVPLSLMPMQAEMYSRCCGFFNSIMCLPEQSICKQVMKQNLWDAMGMSSSARNTNWCFQLLAGLRELGPMPNWAQLMSEDEWLPRKEVADAVWASYHQVVQQFQMGSEGGD